MKGGKEIIHFSWRIWQIREKVGPARSSSSSSSAAAASDRREEGRERGGGSFWMEIRHVLEYVIVVESTDSHIKLRKSGVYSLLFNTTVFCEKFPSSSPPLPALLHGRRIAQGKKPC